MGSKTSFVDATFLMRSPREWKHYNPSTGTLLQNSKKNIVFKDTLKTQPEIHTLAYKIINQETMVVSSFFSD
jgi:hypothetical protein